MTTVADQFGYSGPYSKHRKFLCGTEYEIEDVKANGINSPFLHTAVDNSLRNNGIEVKTNPVSFEQSLELFDVVHSQLKLGKEPFTDRTSIHVHINIQALSLEEVRQLVLTYALFEPLFFKFVGPIRQGSIYCVPLSYTYLPSHYKQPIQELWKRWQKYTAFNISPMCAGKDGVEGLGTIEFRHLYGTGDKKVYQTWLSAIKELYTFIEQNDGFNIIKEIERDLSPKDLLAHIIPTFYTLYKDDVNSLCVNSLLDVKLSTGGLTK
jgi:hypothetical protein